MESLIESNGAHPENKLDVSRKAAIIIGLLEMIREEKETVGLLKEQQMIFPEWMQKAVEGLKDSDFVTVVRQYTPFGTFVTAIQK